MNTPNFPRYLMSPGAVRLVSSRNQHTGKITTYSNWKHRAGLALVSLCALGIVLVGVAWVLKETAHG